MQAEGITLRLPDDLADLVELNKRADAVTADLPSADYLACLKPEVHVGTVVLRRPSLGAVEFIESRLAPWFEDDPANFIRGLAYCLAEGRNPSALWAFDEKPAFAKRLKEWSRSISCDFHELKEAVEKFKTSDEDTTRKMGTKPAQSDRGWMLDLLMSEYGGTIEQWVWQTPLVEIAVLLKRRRERKEAEAAAEGKVVPTDSDSPYIRALYLFRDFEARFMAKKKGAT